MIISRCIDNYTKEKKQTIFDSRVKKKKMLLNKVNEILVQYTL